MGYLTSCPAVASLLQRNVNLPRLMLLDEVNNFGSLPVIGEHRRNRKLLHFHRLQHSTILKFKVFMNFVPVS